MQLIPSSPGDIVLSDQYAIGWSVEGGDDHPPVKSPYDRGTKHYAVGDGKQTGRYELAGAFQEVGQTDWTVESLYRVVKAVARKYADMGLSPNHGVTCAQFVVYCYQAAFLEMKFGHFINSGILVHLLTERASAKFLKLQSVDKSNPLKAALEEGKADHLPVGLRVEPKAVLIGFLLELLEKAGSGFARVGFLVHKEGKLALWTTSPGEQVEDVKLETVLQAF